MTELTLHISNDTAARLAPIQQQLPQLLQQIAQSVPVDRPAAVASPPKTAYPVYNEFLDFLLTAPSPQEIMAFKVSAAAQSRLRELLEKNRDNRLTDAEQGELDAYEQGEYVMTLLKAKAHRQLKQQDENEHYE